MIIENNLSPVLLDLGFLQIRWYGVFFGAGLVLAYTMISKIFRKEKFSLTDLDSLVIYLFVGLVVGARLGHILFYNFSYFWQHPLEIFAVWKGGLASHGATIGLFLSYALWCKIHKTKFTKYPDALIMGVPIAAMFVRIGNYFNSEIIGVPTNGNWGVVFTKLGEMIPRHPAQLYEAGLNFVIFFILLALYLKWGLKKKPPMTFLFLYLLMYFGGRIITESWKARFVFPESFPLSMGQILSIAVVLISLIGLACLFLVPKTKHSKNK